jgi:hypothetical protein
MAGQIVSTNADAATGQSLSRSRDPGFGGSLTRISTDRAWTTNP